MMIHIPNRLAAQAEPELVSNFPGGGKKRQSNRQKIIETKVINQKLFMFHLKLNRVTFTEGGRKCWPWLWSHPMKIGSIN